MVFNVLRNVFSNVWCILLALLVAFFVASAVLLLPNLSSLMQVVLSNSVDFVVKSNFVLGLYLSLFTNFTVLSALNLIVIAGLFGTNVALLVYYIRSRRTKQRGVTVSLTSVGGLVSGLLGIGCAACGSIILTALLGMLGAGSLLSLLPLHGAEFGLIGVLVLLFSNLYVIKQINKAQVCL